MTAAHKHAPSLSLDMRRALLIMRAMNFQQLRSVREAQRRGFNLTEVANALHTSQPGISRQIRELEDELGVEIFVRAGKRPHPGRRPRAALGGAPAAGRRQPAARE